MARAHIYDEAEQRSIWGLEQEEGLESGSEDSSSESPGRSCAKRFMLGAVAGASLVFLCAAVAWFCIAPPEGFMRGSTSSALTREEAPPQAPVLMAPPPRPVASAPAVDPEYQRLQEVAAEPAPVVTPVPQPVVEQELPSQRPPTNICRDNEELFAGLCYKKCEVLTGGQDPIRTSPWTCCAGHPCRLNQKGDLGSHVACTGYDIAGDGSCPHRPGSCLGDEELLLGICYKKCSILAGQEYPNRVGPATCCKDSGLGCLDFRKDLTSKEFAVGGTSTRGHSQASGKACGSEGELLLGVCFKKCSILTGGEYPHRMAAATCCKALSRLPFKGDDGAWHMGCLDFRLDKTRSKFNVRLGGGNGAKAHLPMRNLTEVSRSMPTLHV